MSWIVRFFGFLEETRVPAPWKGVSIAQLNPFCLELCQPGRPARTRSSISTPGKMASYRPSTESVLGEFSWWDRVEAPRVSQGACAKSGQDLRHDHKE